MVHKTAEYKMQEQFAEQEHVLTYTPKRKDRLFNGLSRRYTHDSQVLPSYGEFCLGHGDPLMQASLQHGRRLASPRRSTMRSFDVSANNENPLEQLAAPFSELDIKDDAVCMDKKTTAYLLLTNWLVVLSKKKQHNGDRRLHNEF